MKLFPKILGIGLVGLFIALAIAVVSMYSGAQLLNAQLDNEKIVAFRTKVTEAKEAHLLWRMRINDAIINTADQLTVQRNHTLCDFGKWYYSDEAKALVAEMPQSVQKLFADLASGHSKVHEWGGKLIDMWDKEDMPTRIAFFQTEIIPLVEAFVIELDGLRAETDKEALVIHDRVESLVQFQRWAIWGSLAFGAIVLLLYNWITASSIAKPLSNGARIVGAIATLGDLDEELPPSIRKRKDEVGDLARSIHLILEESRYDVGVMTELASGIWTRKIPIRSDIDRMNQGMESMIQQVSDALHEIDDGVRQVATDAGEVSSAAQSLSSGAQESAASLEEISASMQEISNQTKTNAENAGKARDLAQKASKAATEGQQVMQGMTESMKRITQNSNEIQRVIKVIDDIAFQTNLLALNAAVEAARAGQHGKGFAVVAEEVRNLASRSAKAAQETSELIAKSGQEIEKGDEVAAHTAEFLNTIVEQIKETTDLVAGIAIASDEQAQGVNQVTIGLQQIDSVTQQNTAAAEESASAASEMNLMAVNLQKLVAKFKLR